MSHLGTQIIEAKRHETGARIPGDKYSFKRLVDVLNHLEGMTKLT